MGWDFFCDPAMNRKRVVEHCLAQSTWGERFTILRHSLVGNHLWIAVERKNDDGTTERFIALDLLKGGGKGSGWGHKGISESMGPCEVDCPLYMLDLVPPPKDSEYAAGWRERVREYHARKRDKREWKAGQDINLFGRRYTLLEPRTTWKGRKAGWYARGHETGQRYRVSAANMARAEVVP